MRQSVIFSASVVLFLLAADASATPDNVTGRAWARAFMQGAAVEGRAIPEDILCLRQASENDKRAISANDLRELFKDYLHGERRATQALEGSVRQAAERLEIDFHLSVANGKTEKVTLWVAENGGRFCVSYAQSIYFTPKRLQQRYENDQKQQVDSIFGPAPASQN